MTTSVWTVKAVNLGTGASPVTLSGVAVRSVTKTLNEPETADLEVRTLDSALPEFLNPDREIQIWRDSQVVFWGPVVRVEINGDRAYIQCAGAWWYLTRRHFGRTDRINYITNPQFEAGLTGWTNSGANAVIDSRSSEGVKSVRLTGVTPGHDTFLHQTYTHNQFHPLGDEVTIVGWVWVDNASYSADAVNSVGLYVERRAADTTLLDIEFEPINAATPKDQWVRLEVTLPFVKENDTIQVRLYPPFGTAWWDSVSLTLQESLSFIEQDMATIIRGIVRYAQDQFPGFSHGKSDVGLAVEAAPTGVVLSKTYQFADHENIADKLLEFTERRGGVDYAVELTSTTRTLVATYPQRGAELVSGFVFGADMVSFRWSHDRSQVANNVVILGSGDGPDREEGGAIAAGTPTIEDVSVAPDGTTIAELDRLAAERLAVVTNPEVLEITTALYGAADVGDWVPVTIAVGAVNINDVYRVVSISVDPSNDSSVITLNLRDPETPEAAMARFPRAVDACTNGAGGVWVVGSDGGVGAYAGATFHGSLPNDSIIPNAPIVAIVPHGTGGYWLVAADTGIFAYGNAPARGPYLAMVTTEYAQGDRAIIAAEPLDPGVTDNLLMIADDGATYAGDLTP